MPEKFQAPLLTIIIPAFNEAQNLPILYRRIKDVLDAKGVDWEIILIDDHSSDSTFEVAQKLNREDNRIQGYRLSRNFGSHKAILCGFDHAKGDCCVALAADQQDPPEIIPSLLKQWQEGAQVVWAVRQQREGEKATTVGFARIYYLIMRHLFGMKNMPSTGADCFLIDRVVLNAVKEIRETNVSLFLLLTWLGFRQERVFYTKQARGYGRSGWSLGKKIKLFIDSITAFSYLPIRFISCCGLLVSLGGFIYAGVVITHWMVGKPVVGWSSLMIVILLFGGLQMLMMGLLGEYLWRALDESRQRPRYIIEKSTKKDEAITIF